MKRQGVTNSANRPLKPSVTKANALQRHGQTMTVLSGRHRAGPSVRMLFEAADLQAIGQVDPGRKDE